MQPLQDFSSVQRTGPGAVCSFPSVTDHLHSAEGAGQTCCWLLLTHEMSPPHMGTAGVEQGGVLRPVTCAARALLLWQVLRLF